MPRPICLTFDAHATRRAASRAPASDGSRIEISSATIANVTKVSTSVKPRGALCISDVVKFCNWRVFTRVKHSFWRYQQFPAYTNLDPNASPYSGYPRYRMLNVENCSGFLTQIQFFALFARTPQHIPNTCYRELSPKMLFPYAPKQGSAGMLQTYLTLDALRILVRASNSIFVGR